MRHHISRLTPLYYPILCDMALHTALTNYACYDSKCS
jgi:hypothetical protein